METKIIIQAFPIESLPQKFCVWSLCICESCLVLMSAVELAVQTSVHGFHYYIQINFHIIAFEADRSPPTTA
jgi:hypothetical protein